VGSDLLDTFKFPLLEPGLELLLLCPLPEFQLPHGLLSVSASVGVKVFLTSCSTDRMLTSDTLVRLGFIGARNLSQILKIKNTPDKTLGGTSLRVTDWEVLVADSHGRLRGLLERG